MPATPLVDPEEFFQDRPDPGLWLPALIVTLNALTQWSGGMSLFASLSDDLPSQTSLLLVFGALLVVFVVIQAVVWWLIVTAILYGISAVVGGSGEFMRLLGYVGWGYLPALISGVLTLPVLLVSIPPGATVATVFTSPPPFWRIVQALGLLVILWQGYIWVFAMKQARDLTLRAAVITTALPVLLMGSTALWVYLGYTPS